MCSAGYVEQYSIDQTNRPFVQLDWNIEYLVRAKASSSPFCVMLKTQLLLLILIACISWCAAGAAGEYFGGRLYNKEGPVYDSGRE